MYWTTRPRANRNWLYHTLVQQREVLKEFDIIKTWNTLDWLPRHGLLDSVSLFRTHFYVFHQLYHLKQELINDKIGDLSIHALEIKFMPWNNSDQEPRSGTNIGCADGLAHYYLDWRPLFETTATQIEDLMNFARTGFKQPLLLQSAIKRFELQPPISEASIKKAYRKLAQENHPDKGGSVRDLQDINQERDLLLRWLHNQ